MNIKILTPELVVFEREYRCNPYGQMDFKIENENFAKFFDAEPQRNNCYTFTINGGVIEFNNNSGIILCD